MVWEYITRGIDYASDLFKHAPQDEEEEYEKRIQSPSGDTDELQEQGVVDQSYLIIQDPKKKKKSGTDLEKAIADNMANAPKPLTTPGRMTIRHPDGSIGTSGINEQVISIPPPRGWTQEEWDRHLFKSQSIQYSLQEGLDPDEVKPTWSDSSSLVADALTSSDLVTKEESLPELIPVKKDLQKEAEVRANAQKNKSKEYRELRNRMRTTVKNTDDPVLRNSVKDAQKLIDEDLKSKEYRELRDKLIQEKKGHNIPLPPEMRMEAELEQRYNKLMEDPTFKLQSKEEALKEFDQGKKEEALKELIKKRKKKRKTLCHNIILIWVRGQIPVISKN